jgi:hypothetical protein
MRKMKYIDLKMGSGNLTQVCLIRKSITQRIPKNELLFCKVFSFKKF